jgi:hypothetical protein
MRSSRCPLVACLDVMGSSVPPAPMDLFGSSALCWASEFARFPKLRGYANLNPQRDDARRWPGTPITLRQGARVIEDSRRLRVVSSQ